MSTHKWDNHNLYLDQPITQGWCQPIAGHVLYPTGGHNATKLGLFCSIAINILNVDWPRGQTCNTSGVKCCILIAALYIFFCKNMMYVLDWRPWSSNIFLFDIIAIFWCHYRIVAFLITSNWTIYSTTYSQKVSNGEGVSMSLYHHDVD